MNDPVAHWHTEHVYFGQLLKLLRKEVDVFHGGEEPNYELMLDIIAYLRDYSDSVHHPREDIAFERLARHCPDLRIVLSRLQQEHRVIARAGENLHDRLEAILAGEVIAREDVEADAATFLVYYETHIAKEESDVLARAAKHLTGDDWEAVRAFGKGRSDPLFGKEAHERFKELRRQIAREA
ncbi:MAG: hemerythrin domain-containing protein [Burkholderiales bacterium]